MADSRRIARDTSATASAATRSGAGRLVSRTTGAHSRWFRWLTRIGWRRACRCCVGCWICRSSRDLPDAEKLLDYEPPLPTMVRGIDGEIVHSYARERRVQLQFADFPQPLINAFLAAEDKTFWTHGGVDYHRASSARWSIMPPSSARASAPWAARRSPSRSPRTS